MIVYYNKEEIDIKIVFDIFFDHELSHLNIYRLLFYCILGFEPSQRCLAARHSISQYKENTVRIMFIIRTI